MLIHFWLLALSEINPPLWREIASADTIIEVSGSKCAHQTNAMSASLKGESIKVPCGKRPGIYFYVTNAAGRNEIKFYDRTAKGFKRSHNSIRFLINQEKRASIEFNSCTLGNDLQRIVSTSIDGFNVMHEKQEAERWIMEQNKETIVAAIRLTTDKSPAMFYQSDGYQLNTDTKGKLVSTMLSWRFSSGGQISYLHFSPGPTGESNGELAWKWFGWRICQGLENDLFAGSHQPALEKHPKAP